MDASTWLKYKRSKVIANGFDNQKITFAPSGGTVLDTRIGTQENVFKNEVYQKCCPNDTGALYGPAPLGRLGLIFRSGLNPRIAPRALTTNRVVLPITYTGSITVNWGDGTTDSSGTHTYASFGTYTVLVTGTITEFGPPFTSGWTGSNLLTTVTAWPRSLTSLAGAFSGAFNLTSVPNTVPPVNDMSYMFAGASSFVQDLSTWNVGSVLTAVNMFMGSPNMSMMGFNGIPESVYRPSTMSLQMRFKEPTSITLPLEFSTPVIVLWGDGSGNTFSNGPPRNSPVSHTYDISGLYTLNITGSVTTFGNLDIAWQGVENLVSVLSWIPSITNLNYVFGESKLLTSVATPPSGVTDMAWLFYNSSFNGNVSGWNVSNVISMEGMFENSSFTGQGLNTWNPSACIRMTTMFRHARIYTNNLSNIDLTNWNISNVIEKTNFFSSNNNIDITISDPYSPFCYMELVFDTGSYATPLPLQWIGTIKVDFGDGIQLPYTAPAIPTINSGITSVKIYGKITEFSTTVGPWDTEHRLTAVLSWGAYTLTNLTRAFYDCINLVSVPDLPANVTNTSYMFNNCPIDIDFTGWNTSNVTDMSEMFAYSGTTSGGFSGVGINSWNTSKVKSMFGMFLQAKNFNPTSYTLSLSQWDVSGVTDMHNMFEEAGQYDANGIEQWDTRSVKRIDNMFYRTNASYATGNFKTNLSQWNVSNVTSYTNFFNPSNTDTTLTDSNSPYYIQPPTITATAYDSSATVVWTAPIDIYNKITGYTVTYSSGPIITWTTGPLTATFRDLTNGTAYTFTVNAKYGTIVGPGASSTSVTPSGKPGTPTSVSAEARDRSAIVSWVTPSDNGTAIINYDISSNPATTPETGSSPYTFPGLTNGTDYTFTVTARNANGTGSPSASSASVTPNVVPDAPTIGTATAGDTTATVTWTAPTNNGTAIIKYDISSNPATTSQSGTSPHTFTGLTNGTTYTFTVTATNLKGTSSPSASSASVTPNVVPDAPTIGTATAGDTTATVSWIAPNPNGGTAITGYTVTSSPTTSNSANTSQPADANATSLQFIGLTNGTSYTFTVTATNLKGTGSPSASSASVTPIGAPGAPTSVSATTGDTTATVSWTAPANTGGSTITEYTVTSSPENKTAKWNLGDGNLRAIVTGLTNGTSYTFTVTATNANNLTSDPSNSSNSVIPNVVPGAPTIGTATAGDTTASVSWIAPNPNGGTAITGYTVTSSPTTSNSANTSQPADANATSLQFTGLTNGTSYTFTVTATNLKGTGSPSASSASVTPNVVPGAPTIGTATAGDTTASVSWIAPTNNGTAITGYTVTSSPTTSNPANTSQPAGANATSLQFTGLTNGTSYTFTVTATNLKGTGSPSASSASVTPIGVPSAPTSVSAEAGDRSATVSWTAPINTGGSAISKYTVTSSSGPIITWTTGPLTATFLGLTNGTPYTFTVTATNDTQLIGPSASSNSVIPNVVPGAPTIGTATAGDTTATVRWTAPTNNGTAITGYTVTSNPVTSNPANTSQPADANATSLQFIGLTNGTSYTFTVTATNLKGTSQPSTASTSVTPIQSTPSAPRSVSAIADNGSARVSWLAPLSPGNGEVRGYDISSNPATTTQSATYENVTFTGLTNGTAYTFIVTAKSTTGNGTPSSPSNSVTPFGVAPGAPSSVSAEAGDRSATVSWTAPSNNGGSAITGYTVTSYSTLPSISQPVGASPYIFTGLTNGISYSFTVTATTVYGTGLPTASNYVVPNVVPGAPTIGTATAGDTTATVSWTAPTNNGTAITGYTVTSNPATSNPANTSQPAGANATSLQFTGLTNGTAYTFTVTATNLKGTSQPSASSNSVTPIVLIILPTFTVTPSDTIATIVFATSTNHTYTVTGQEYTKPDGYGLVAFGPEFTATTTGSAGNFTVTGLNNYSYYAFKINCTVGSNTASTPFSTKEQCWILPAPMILQFNTTTSSVPVTLPITGGTNVQVDFGTGPQPQLGTTLPQNGNNTIVKIHGSFTTFSGTWTGRTKLVSIDSWGNNSLLTNLREMCRDSLVTSVPETLPSSVRSLNGMFANATVFDGDLTAWDVTEVTDMRGMFLNASSFTGTDISEWNVSKATDVRSMFYGANAMYNAAGKFNINLRTYWELYNLNLIYQQTDMIYCTNPDIGDQTLYDEKSPFFINLYATPATWDSTGVYMNVYWNEIPWNYTYTSDKGHYNLKILASNNSTVLKTSDDAVAGDLSSTYDGIPLGFNVNASSYRFYIELTVKRDAFTIGTYKLTYDYPNM